MAGLGMLVGGRALADDDLTLESPGVSCTQPVGASLTVLLRVSNLQQEINGVQVLLTYDDAVWSLDAIQAGDGAGSPWDVGLGVSDIQGNQITYSIALLADSTTADAVVARFRFTVLAEGVGRLAFRASEPPLITKLSAFPNGDVVVPAEHGPAEMVTASPGDGNGDGNVDLWDAAGLVSCMTAPSGPADPPVYPLGPPDHCHCYDLDDDGDVDLADFAVLQTAIDLP